MKKIKVGKLECKSNIFYAPLAGCSDFAFRRMSAAYNPGLIFCEMVKMDALIRNDRGTFHILEYSPDMHPIGGQVCGSKPEIAGKAASIIQDLGFDVVDFNCGCPVDKVTKDGSGSGMLKNPQLIGDCIANMVAAVDIPVTVKIRAGWDEKGIYAAEITKIAEKAGAQVITVHGRTREQGYKGPANWEWIKQAKEAATTIQVFGNGDIFTAHDALKMIEATKCDGVLVARGTLGQPWIADEIRTLLRGEELREKTLEERKRALLQHLHYIVEHLPEKQAVLDMRRVGCWYFPKMSGTKTVRESIVKANSIEEVRAIINAI